MKLIHPIFYLFISTVAIIGCDKNKVTPPEYYTCNELYTDSINSHPKAHIYQNILANHRKNGLVGATILVKDKEGLWIGADGKSDIASDINMKSCNTFLIASISKVFTAAATFRYIDKGIFQIDDPINKWLNQEILNQVENTKTATIGNLLAHTSGIADYYTLGLELDRINKESNKWSKEEVLKYVYGAKATNEVGEIYYYSNTNYLLLAMILEKVSGLSFEQVYRDEVFIPLGLSSAYYDELNPIPEGCVKGYVDIYGNGKYVESKFLYEDELGIGGDGGVAINAYDLSVFLEQLLKGNLITKSSLDQMRNWFDIPQDWQGSGEYAHRQNGYGLERFKTKFGYATGHTGGIDGFVTMAVHFEEQDMTYVILTNTAGNEDGNNSYGTISEEITHAMFAQ